MTGPGQRKAGSPEASELPASCAAPLEVIEEHLDRSTRDLPLPGNLLEAVRYALLGGGKRLRPLLAWHACCAAGGTGEDSLPAGIALELIHAFSLVHDDLPALDNDELRRGRPTLHIYAGEPMAILAGDCLMVMAFDSLARTSQRAPAQLAARLSGELAGATIAMIGGQVYDTLGGFPAGLVEQQKLELIHRNKTAALIRAACRMGAICADPEGPADSVSLKALTGYGESIGLMFQIVDDLLDVQGTAESIGKRTGKDSAAGKLTYPGLLGVEASRAEVARLEGVAVGSLEPLGERAHPLVDLCRYLARRAR